MLIKTVLYSSLLSLLIATNINAQKSPMQLRVVKTNNVNNNEDNAVLKDGLYEFKITSELSHEEGVRFYRILVIDTAKFPEFEFVFAFGHIIPTPVSYSGDGESWQINESAHLWGIFNGQQPIIYIDDNYGFGHKKILAFNDVSSGDELYYDENNIKQKSGTFQISKFTRLEDINLKYVRYQAKIKKVDKENFSMHNHCSQNNYTGFAGFIKIPEVLADAKNGWIMGLKVAHGKCSVHITESIAGQVKKGLVIKNGTVSFIVTRTNSSSSATALNKLVFLNKHPKNNQQLAGKIYLNDLYETVPQIIDLEMNK